MIQGTARPDVGRLIWLGIVGGIIAGLVFAMFEMLAAAVLGLPFVMPLRMIGAIGIGPEALNPAYPLVTAIAIGVAIHMILSAVFGAVFGLIVAAVPQLMENATNLILSATIYGFLLWVVNFLIIAGVLGIFPWFTQANTVVQIIAHAFFFGSVLGFYFSQMLPLRRETL